MSFPGGFATSVVAAKVWNIYRLKTIITQSLEIPVLVQMPIHTHTHTIIFNSRIILEYRLVYRKSYRKSCESYPFPSMFVYIGFRV
jgi:hypothetical protein